MLLQKRGVVSLVSLFLVFSWKRLVTSPTFSTNMNNATPDSCNTTPSRNPTLNTCSKTTKTPQTLKLATLNIVDGQNARLKRSNTLHEADECGRCTANRDKIPQ